MPNTTNVPTPVRTLHKWGGIGTALWVFAIVAYSIWKQDDFAGLEPNAMGDFFAGAFAPLAFLWLVLGFFQQGEELRHSADALWLQGRELQNSVEQQRELVNVTREQLKLEGEVLREQRAELIRKSRPIFRLRSGTMINSGGEIKVNFYLSNVGRDCTDVNIAVTDVAKPVKRDVFPAGDEIVLLIRFPGGVITPTTVAVTYIDERLIEGRSQFAITYREEDGFRISTEDFLGTAT